VKIKRKKLEMLLNIAIATQLLEATVKQIGKTLILGLFQNVRRFGRLK
jgi:hypothetical protein